MVNAARSGAKAMIQESSCADYCLNLSVVFALVLSKPNYNYIKNWEYTVAGMEASLKQLQSHMFLVSLQILTERP